jgi:hypothetical protein
MAERNSRYRLMIGPGILNDGTFGIYALPEDNPDTEVHLDGQFATVEQAKAVASRYLEEQADRLSSNEIVVKDTRSRQEFTLAEILKESELESTLSKSLERYFEPIKTFDPKKLIIVSVHTPYTVSWIALIIYFFSISLTIPRWFPIVGEYVGGKTFSPRELALILPYVLAGIVIYVYVKTRIKAARNSHHKDLLVTLAVRYKWSKEDVGRIVTRVISTEGHGWIAKLGQYFHKMDSDTLTEIGKAGIQQGKQSLYNEAFPFVVKEDFESRIHALAFMERERNFGSSAMGFDPFFFLLHTGRAKQRLRSILRASGEKLERDVQVLPTEPRLSNMLVFVLTGVGRVLIIGTLIYSLYLRRPGTVWAWIALSLAWLVIMVTAPIWNFQLLIRHRGLPRGWSVREVAQGRKNIVAVM